jgi:CHAT domain
MAWSPGRRFNAGDSRLITPETTPASIPTNPATGPSSQFWGNKYVLGVLPEDKSRARCGGRLPGKMERRPGKDEVLYAHYWQEKPGRGPDRVSALGQRFAPVLGKAFANGIRIVREKPDFTLRLRDDRRRLQILWTFTHGHSGEVHGELLTPNGSVIVNGQEVAGQRINFSESKFISARELDRGTIQDQDPQYFVGRPFVFLNGCETGTEGSRGTTELSLPGIFLKRGARGVVATEASIWDTFGYSFGEMFLRNLTAGNMDAGEAMLETRRAFLRDSNNPFGLLYSYYGNPSVRLAP